MKNVKAKNPNPNTKNISETEKNILTFETFRKPNSFNINNLKGDKPTCFNSFVNYRKYRVTIEEIEEPKEVLIERLQDLWDHSDNYHNDMPLEVEAKKLGYTFPNRSGSKRNLK
jgi:hypothetical protein